MASTQLSPGKLTTNLFLITILFALCNGLAVGQESKPSPFKVIPDLRLWGAKVDLGFQGLELFEDLTSGIWLGLSGAYQTSYYYKNPDGTPIGAADYSDSNPAVTFTDFSQLNLQWNFGLRQEIIGNLLEIGIYYRGWYNNNYPEDQTNPLIANSGLPEAPGSLTHSFSTLIKANAVKEMPVTRIKSGLSAELTGEIAPAGLNINNGQADFSRATLEIKTFLPIYQSVVENKPEFNLFSLYAGFYSITDYIGGASIPYYAAANFGGISYRDGLGGTVRGYESGRFTGQFKTAFSSELRANLPTIFLPGLIPVALIHIDGGYDSENQELLPSIGAGVGIDLFGFGTILVYTHYALKNRALDGNQLSLFELGFGLHF